MSSDAEADAATPAREADGRDAASPDADPVLAVDGLRKRYDDTVALDGVDLAVADGEFVVAVADGEFVAVVGLAGCEKSTLLRVLSGLGAEFGGRVAVDGTDVRDGGSDAVGMVFQEPRLLDWADVRENVVVDLPTDIDPDALTAHERVDDLIETVGLDGFAESHPDELSGGMAQRVSLARGLAYDPSVLLLDEPFSALGRLTKADQQDHLLDVWEARGTTVVLVAHDVEEAVCLADRVVVLGGQPGTVESVVDIDNDRPRTRADAELVALRREVAEALGR